MNNTSNRSTPRGLNARWQSGGDSIIDDSIPLTRLLSTVKHNATFPLFLYFFFLSLPPTAFKRYNILSQVAPLSQISPPLLLRFFDYRTKQPLSLSLVRRSTKGGKKRGNSRDPPQGCQTPAEPEPKYQTLAYSSIEGPDDLSTAYYTSHRPSANFFFFLTRAHRGRRSLRENR